MSLVITSAQAFMSPQLSNKWNQSYIVTLLLFCFCSPSLDHLYARLGKGKYKMTGERLKVLLGHYATIGLAVVPTKKEKKNHGMNQQTIA